MKKLIDFAESIVFALVVLFVLFCIAFTIISIENQVEHKEQRKQNQTEYYEH
ncbi:MAG: hypothetical protein MJ204_02825 [Bacteroidales bacterium]|nr:hypothetical protein [Bacteroidales bacterium]MCQ2605462.1 hypothetical protein [Bacteroidales bacterium]